MANQFDVIVQKYGGSSVAEPRLIRAVAKYIKSCLRGDKRIVVVVSAMGHTTNELISLAHRVCADPPKRELDMLISCGERSSMALLAMALNAIDVKALSLTGSQSGIITDDNHSGAEIIAIKPGRVIDALFNHEVVIIAGFQGISEQKEITTLRRGGSDTTAVAMAAALNAKVCEIYTDVAGVMDVDPRIIQNASILPTLTFEDMESMALYGAKVLAHDAIRLARSFGIAVRIAKTGEPQVGTNIGFRELPVDNQKSLIAITHLRALLRICIPFDSCDRLKNVGGYFLCASVRDSNLIAYISNDISQELVGEKSSSIDAGLALITIHLRKNQLALSILSKINRLMVSESITCEDLIIGGKEIFMVVRDEQLNHALSALHRDLAVAEREQ